MSWFSSFINSVGNDVNGLFNSVENFAISPFKITGDLARGNFKRAGADVVQTAGAAANLASGGTDTAIGKSNLAQSVLKNPTVNKITLGTSGNFAGFTHGVSTANSSGKVSESDWINTYQLAAKTAVAAGAVVGGEALAGGAGASGVGAAGATGTTDTATALTTGAATAGDTTAAAAAGTSGLSATGVLSTVGGTAAAGSAAINQVKNLVNQLSPPPPVTSVTQLHPGYNSGVAPAVKQGISPTLAIALAGGAAALIALLN